MKISPTTLQRYITKCNIIIESGDQAAAEELQKEIIAALGQDLAGLRDGLSNYSFVGFASTLGGRNESINTQVDFINDAKLLRSRLEVEYDKADLSLGKVANTCSTIQKPKKLFISHSFKDRKYIIAFVELLEDIGMPEGSIICTSVPGYGIPGGENIYDWLREQFMHCNLRVVYALSDNYYQSAASLNEMGAAWVTKAVYTLMLLPGFSFQRVTGCVDKSTLGFSLDGESGEINHRLGELKDQLIEEHALKEISETFWERKRDRFTKAIREIKIVKDEETAVDTNYFVAGRLENCNAIECELSTEAIFLLVYAASSNGQIVKLQVLGGTVISAAGKEFVAENSPREAARWKDGLDELLNQGLAKSVGKKGEVFELSGKAFNYADKLKEELGIDTDEDPIAQLKSFEH